MPLDIYQEVTDRILAALEAGTAPWRDPIVSRLAGGSARNLVSDRPYRGVNTFLLAMTAMT